MRINDIITFLESKAPRVYQESYDNSGLITGNKDGDCTGVLVCLDSTEAIIQEAIDKGCNMVVAHHPIVFSGLKSLTGKNYIERTIIKAIKNDIAIYAIHTNLDNMFHGVNRKIADKLNLTGLSILNKKRNLLSKLSTFVPESHAEIVRQALFNSGAGKIGHYDSCSFNSTGDSTFKPGEGSNPFVGKEGELHKDKEIKIEVIIDNQNINSALRNLISSHPYEEVAYDIYPLSNEHPYIGSGMIGILDNEMSHNDFLQHVKQKLNAPMIRYTDYKNPTIKTVAICGGSGSFLLGNARAQGADAFVTADYKYHQFFDSEGDIMICDIGHFESEQYTIELLVGWLTEKFAKFAVHFTEQSTNPINYF